MKVIFFKRLTFRILLPIIFFMLLLVAGIYGFVSKSIRDFADGNIKENLVWMSSGINLIIDKNIYELIRSGVEKDLIKTRIRQGITLAAIEEFARQNQIEVLIFKKEEGKKRKIKLSTSLINREFIEQRALISQIGSSKETVSINSGKDTYYAYQVKFYPWDWHVYLFKNRSTHNSLL